ncbi:ABA 3 protein [Apiospora saccharicola]|uniref:ABA 3 protein n=1 Tax=Apiospora saccharicola TaxID=335842 RepID=A0ABR1TH84_9PEZI
MSLQFRDVWYYPPDIAHDLDGIDALSEAQKQETYACAWEYLRCCIPTFTNWKRYIAFMRIVIMGIIAEYRGDLINIEATDNILGYSLDRVMADLFEGSHGHALMAREMKAFLLVTSEKSSEQRRHGELFRRYVDGIAQGPRSWFRMRDCDALARFSMGAALACNDIDDAARWPSDAEFELLAEIGDVMYDAVAFYKHRSEGETNSTFAYVPAAIRADAYRVAREVLFAIEVAVAHRPESLVLTNFTRFFGGPIHMMMRRYRFVEDDLSLGRVETSDVVALARQHVKLWNRLDAPTTTDQAQNQNHQDDKTEGREEEAAPHCDRYRSLVRDRAEELLFPGLSDILERAGTPHCNRCRRATYGAHALHRFGGVELCPGCRAMWRGYVESLPERAKEVYPHLVLKAPPPLSTQESQRMEQEKEPKKEGAMVAEEYTPEMARGIIDNSRFEAGSVEGFGMDANSHYVHGNRRTAQTVDV